MNFQALLERLRAHAEVIECLTRGVGLRQARWKPSASEWSILEVINHLADEEVEDFRLRVDLTLHRPGEPWPAIDPERWPTERRYNERDLVESTERFRARRRRSLAWLETLDDPEWDRCYEHPSIGSLRAGDVMTSWVAHDHIHVRQLNRLHRQYLERELSEYSPAYAGPW